MRNVNTSYDIMDVLDPIVHGKLTLQHAFFALGQCLNTFRHWTHIHHVDGVFHTRKYKGQILTTIEVDGNNQVLWVGFAFFESENSDSWYLSGVKIKDVMCHGLSPTKHQLVIGYATVLEQIMAQTKEIELGP